MPLKRKVSKFFYRSNREVFLINLDKKFKVDVFFPHGSKVYYFSLQSSHFKSFKCYTIANLAKILFKVLKTKENFFDILLNQRFE
jgi:hypothetical protein